MSSAAPAASAVTYAGQLAHVLATLDYDNLPPDTVHAAKRALLDTIGAGIQGSLADEARLVAEATDLLSGPGPGVIWGDARRTGLAAAALANGTAAHAREMDDFGGCGHSGAVVIPAVLAIVGSGAGTTGRDVLTAIVSGYEAAARVTESLGGYARHNARGWHSTGTAGAFGAAAAAASVRHLEPARFAHALALAGTYTGGVWAFIRDGAMSKRLHPGKAAETGVTAAVLAERGFTGPMTIFEADWGGVWNTYAPDDHNESALLNDLGETFRIHASGFKPYAACRGVHSAIDVIFRYRDRLTLDAIDRIIVTAHPQRMQMVGNTTIKTVLDAQMSLAYGVAVALVHGDASVAQYEPQVLHDPAVRSIIDRVEIVSDAALPAAAQPVVEIRLTDGQVLRDSVPFALGAPENPMSDDALIGKFRSLATFRYSATRTEQLLDEVWNLDSRDSVVPLIALLGPPDETTP